jgi:hypothetical protein
MDPDLDWKHTIYKRNLTWTGNWKKKNLRTSDLDMENTMYKKSTRILDPEDSSIQIGRKASEANSDHKKFAGELARACRGAPARLTCSLGTRTELKAG